MKKTITMLLLAVFVSGVNAQTAPAWVKFSGPSNYQNYDAQDVHTATDTFGNIYTAASMSDTANNLSKAMLVKYNAAGVQQWVQYYDNNDPNYNGSYVTRLLVDGGGNAYLCGYGITGNTTNNDFLLVKFDNTGAFQWATSLDGGSAGDDYVTSSTFDASGNIIVAGYANHQSGTTGDDIYVTKWSTAGTLLWSYIWNNTGSNDEDRALAVASDLSNNIFITGSTYQSATDRDMVTLKLDSTGANQWTKIYAYSGDGNDDRGYSVTTDSLGNSYVTGAAADWTTVKYDPSGNVTWQTHYTTFDLERFSYKKVLLDKAGNVITIGTAFEGSSQQDNYVVSKYTKTGTLIWSTDINSPAGGGSIETAYDAVVDSAGYVYITGKYDGPNGTDILTSVVSPTGTTVWNNPFANTLNAGGTDRGYSIALDRNRNIIVAGVSETRNSNSANPVDVVTFKYNALSFATAIADVSLNASDLSVYPNPTRGNVFIRITDENLIGAEVSVTNMIGQTVLSEKITSLNQQLDMGNQAKGLYVVTVKTEQSAVSKKIIIE